MLFFEYRAGEFSTHDSKLPGGTRSPLPDITGHTALAVQPDVVNAKYHVITNATYNDTIATPVPAKYIQHCMDLQLAVDPYKNMCFLKLPKTHIVS